MLAGKVALVTGASRGIGRAIALKLAGMHATVLVNYNGSKDRADAVVKEMKVVRNVIMKQITQNKYLQVEMKQNKYQKL